MGQEGSRGRVGQARASLLLSPWEGGVTGEQNSWCPREAWRLNGEFPVLGETKPGGRKAGGWGLGSLGPLSLSRPLPHPHQAQMAGPLSSPGK